MISSWSLGTTQDTGPWPPEVPPQRPPQPPYYPPGPPEPPHPPAPPPVPILPTWEEPIPEWEARAILDRLLDERVILATGDLDAKMAERASAQLLLLDRTDHTRPIELHLSCRGSDLESSLALAAGIDLAQAEVRVVVTSTLAGPALAVLCAAQERVAHRYATFVLDVPRAAAQGSATAAATQAEEHRHLVGQLVERIATASGRPEAQVDQDLRSGRVLSAEEAKSYGLVTSVV